MQNNNISDKLVINNFNSSNMSTDVSIGLSDALGWWLAISKALHKYTIYIYI